MACYGMLWPQHGQLTLVDRGFQNSNMNANLKDSNFKQLESWKSIDSLEFQGQVRLPGSPEISEWAKHHISTPACAKLRMPWCCPKVGREWRKLATMPWHMTPTKQLNPEISWHFCRSQDWDLWLRKSMVCRGIKGASSSKGWPCLRLFPQDTKRSHGRLDFQPVDVWWWEYPVYIIKYIYIHMYR